MSGPARMRSTERNTLYAAVGSTKPPTPTSDPTMLPTNNLVYTGWRLWTVPEATTK